jgi:IPT/TIG domain
VVSTVSVLIFQSGILAVGGQLPSQTTTDTTKNLLYYIVAFVVGYREDVFRELIKRAADVLLTPPPEEGAAPVIKFFAPPQAAAGEQVKVVGSGFTGATSVKLGGQTIHFVGELDTQMTFTVPEEAQKGLTSLAVTTKHGTHTMPFTIS